VFESFSSILLVWVLLYLLHSSFLFGIAFVIDQCTSLGRSRHAELLWRTALFGGIFTATLQACLLFSASAPVVVQTPAMTATSTVSLTNPADTAVASSPSSGANSIAGASTDSRQRVVSQNSTAAENLSAATPVTVPTVITIPHFVREFAPYLGILWLLIAILTSLHTLVEAFRLNRLAKTFPLAKQLEIDHILKKFSRLEGKTIVFRISDQWNSPLVTPDGTICLPTWAYSELNSTQFEAMLAHELSHVARHDPAWRLATQLLTRICFFQPLQWIAMRRLALLAELACDENAALHSGKPHALAEALYICAKALEFKKAPSLALAMARAASPLLIRIETLLNNPVPITSAKPSTQLWNFGKVSAVVTMLACVIFAMPPIVVQFKNKIDNIVASVKQSPSLQAIATQIGSSLQATPLSAKSSEKYTDQNLAIVAENTSPRPGLRAHQTGIIPANYLTNEKIGSDAIAAVRATLDSKEYLKTQPVFASSNVSMNISGNPEGQFNLAESIWKDKASTFTAQQAEDLFRKSAAAGNPNAQKYLELLNEREKNRTKISYYLNEFSGNEFKMPEGKCHKPEFAGVPITPIGVEKLVSRIETFANCFNKYNEMLNTASSEDKIIPAEVLKLMSAEEAQRAISHAKKVFASLRINSKMLAEEFNFEKRAWDSKAKIIFAGTRFRDWSMIGRQGFIPNSDLESVQLDDTQNETPELDTRLSFHH
jgi:beta-lactamase regulating signal transducer with metallopeptidase domain